MGGGGILYNSEIPKSRLGVLAISKNCLEDDGYLKRAGRVDNMQVCVGMK